MSQQHLLFFLLFSVLIQNITFAQSGHSSRLNWEYIENEHAKIIFPSGKAIEAQRIQSFITRSNDAFSGGLNEGIKKINIVLRTEQVVSNGYVGIGPFRSEFYFLPPQDFNFTGTSNWLDLLSIHEYRHVQQASFIDRSYVKAFHYLFGQAGWAIGKTIAMPDWFSEGDAVMAETKYSNGGRGRSPYFFARQNAIIRENGLYKFSKARNGSFKDIIPNHYLLGYSMCQNLEAEYGENIWPSILKQSSKFPLFHPFKKSIFKITGERFKDLYKSSNDDINAAFRKNYLEQGQEITPITRQSTIPAFYSFPFYYNNDLYALKESYNTLPTLVKVSGNNKEYPITEIGIAQEDFLAANGAFVTWTVFSRNPRFIYEEYSDIVLLNLATGLKKQITKKGKFFSPHSNHDGSKITAIQRDTSSTVFLSIIDIVSGDVTHKIPLNDLETASFPKWVADDKIVFIGRKNNLLSIYECDINTEVLQEKISPTHHTLNHLSVCEQGLLFSSSASGIDNVYLLDQNGQTYLLSNSSFGAYTPYMNEDSIVASEIHSSGNPLVRFKPLMIQADIPKDAPILLHSSEVEPIHQFSTLSLEENNIKKYGRLGGLQFHSYYIQPDLVIPSFKIYYENTLSNVSGESSISYNVNEQRTLWQSSVAFSSKYPVLNLITNAGSRAAFLVNSEGKLELSRFREVNLSVAGSLPLRYVRGNYNTSLQTVIQIQYKNLSGIDSKFELADQNSFMNGHLSFSIRNLKRTAYQHIRTKCGQEFSINYSKAFANIESGNLLTSGRLFFPGLGKNHSIKLEGQYKNEQITNVYKYSDLFQYHRGGTRFASERASRFSVEYMMPLLYPDFGILNLIYFKRIYANFFYDYAHYQIRDRSIDGNSIGVEIFFDNVYYNEFPVSSGIRLSHARDDVNKKLLTFDFILGYSF